MDKIRKFKKIPKIIEAMQFTGDNFDEISNFIGEGKSHKSGDNILINTLEGQTCAKPGDWIIKGIAGEIYPCNPDVFQKSYEECSLEKEINMSMITFEQIDVQHVKILKNGLPVGEIFSPSGSGEMYPNAVQVCGFSEAFDLWGCACFPGYKDIQLLFDGKKMDGKYDSYMRDDACARCYMMPCQCEDKDKFELFDEESKKNSNPFTVKRQSDLDDRVEKKSK